MARKKDCRFRPGLPPPWAIRSHSNKGGWWIARKLGQRGGLADLLRFVNLIVVAFGQEESIQAADSNNGHYLGLHPFSWPKDDVSLNSYEWRPCLADGEPCTWPTPTEDGHGQG